MKPRRTGGEPPPSAVYAAGKRKQRFTVAINALRAIQNDPLMTLKFADEAYIRGLEEIRKKLEEV